MVRLHYGITDTLDECLEKLGAEDRNFKVSRRASFEQNNKIAKVMAHLDRNSLRRESMPAVITAALKERLDTDSTSLSDDSTDH
jgi:hypothetical protein